MTRPGRTPGRLPRTAASAVLLLGVGLSSVALGENQEIFGWVERAVVGADRIELKAKLDTGAETSSLDATGIRRLRRRSTGQRLVEFDVMDPVGNRVVTLKKPLVREVRIKQHDGSYQTRPVVEVSICLGDVHREIEVSLIDRSEFLYPLLLGRSALAGLVIVDPSLTFTREPSCDGGKGAD